MEVDHHKGARLYQHAAEKGEANAMCGLGFCYENGQGVPRDLQEAVRWRKKAVDRGHAHAMSNLGVMYEKGLGGLTKDEREAL